MALRRSLLRMCSCQSSGSLAEPVMTILMAPLSSSGLYQSGRSLMISLCSATQMRRLMQTIMPLPSAALRALLKVLDDIGGDLLEAAGAAHHRFFACPFGKAPLAFGQFVVFGDFFHALIEDLLVGGGKFDFGQAAFVVDAHRRAVFHRLLDIIDIT